ncbi:hypothetical protein CC80DRAFT_86490 [Byssothecium circinans]|uniref:Uncharacterized protein n=1 Tax=Byssothecium circinans TaxID=147558 RepID=A0A6A5TSZ0_9PLEO|nr:hypothetical protein CC80DRAFT_86490 [Byssothecium circinans]
MLVQTSMPSSAYVKSEPSTPHMDNTRRLPPLQTVLQNQELLRYQDQLRRVSTGSSSSDEDEEHKARLGLTLAPLNLPPSGNHHTALRRLSQVDGHLNRHEPYPTPVPSPIMAAFNKVLPVRTSKKKKAKSCRCDSRSQDRLSSEQPDKRNPKAKREFGNRLLQIASLSRLSRVLQNVNPNLIKEWKRLNRNNRRETEELEDPLMYNKIDTTEGGLNMIIDMNLMLDKCEQWFMEAGGFEHAREIAKARETFGSQDVVRSMHLLQGRRM